MKLKVKRLTETAKLPVKAHPTDAGFDIFADQNCLINDKGASVVATGISIEIPEGYYGRLKGRSGLTSKTLLRVQEGTIDSNYRGGIKVICDVKTEKKVYGYGEFFIHRGDKIGQLIIQPLPQFEVVEVDELTETDRGANGFGSTGV